MIAKLLWNPNLDANKIMDDFLSGYYGNASKAIRKYIDLLYNKMKQSGAKLTIGGTPVDEKETFLSDSLITVYNKLFDQAEKAVSGSPEILQRVRTAHLPVYYAMLEIAKDEKTGKRGAFIIGDNNTLKPNPKIVEILYNFVYLCIRTNVSHIIESRTTPKQYLEEYTRFLLENTSN
jgi:Arc/MetJ-type ribon-helix-helix transcriptional regulator